MAIQLTREGLRGIWPKAPEAVIEAFVRKQYVLDAAGITATRTRLVIALSQVEHETAGFTIPKLTENINYSAERAAQIWPSRFRDARGKPSAAVVRAKYGTAPGWQKKMFDDVYGGRMGNRPGTDDGSRHIGRGGPQVTGRDGYQNVAKYSGVAIDRNVELACAPEYQPEILAGFWTWKGLNPIADAGGIRAVTRPWNGGYIGMADREAKLAGNDPIVARMEKASAALQAATRLPGAPPTPTPPKQVIDAATAKERKARTGGVGAAAAGGASEGAAQSGAVQPDNAIPPQVTYALIGVGIVIVVVASILIWRKKRAVIANWF